MPTLDGIEIKESITVECSEHGFIGVVLGQETARIHQRIHFEWRHQPRPEGRLCLWRYPVGGIKPGYDVCQLPAAHDGMHDDGTGQGNRWSETGSLPREGVA
jgi:hypothetical protein